MGYFEEAFLLSLIEQDGTPNERKYGPKKCYAPDLGICSVVSGLPGIGPLAENAVFLKLKKRGEVRYIERNGSEVDFLVGNSAFEVKYKDSISPKDIEGLVSLRKRGVANKVIITRSPTQGDNIVHMTMSKFLLS
jgi:predicted AAA+ superfamily ATPase